MSHSAIEAELLESLVDDVRADPDAAFRKFRTGDGEVDGVLAEPMGITSTAEDKVVLYHAETGEPREILVNMLRKTLQKKLPNGRPAFSTTPVKEYQLGNVKCFLHPESELRPLMDQLGIDTVCMSAHYKNRVEMEARAKNSHRREWQVYQEWKVEQEKEEDRAFQRAMLQQMTGGRRRTDG